MKIILLFAVLVLAIGSVAKGEKLVLTVAYCPDPFSAGGAIVEVNTKTGAYTVTGKFSWPSELVFGCPALYDPTVWTNQEEGVLFMEFIDDFGAVLKLDLNKAEVTSSADVSDPFFHGFVGMAQQYGLNSTELLGVAPTVEKENSPYCSDGCYNFAGLNFNNGLYRNISDVPFKEAADDVALVTGGSYYTQMGYDLREQRCGPEEFSDCLVEIDAQTGALVKATYTPYQIYQFAPNSVDSANDTVMAWVFGFEGKCKHPDNDFLFAYVNLDTAIATPIACIPQNITVDWDEWIGGFNSDSTLFATASGNSEGDPSQVLVFDTATGAVLVNSQLDGLGKELGAWSDLVFIWAANFIS